MNRSEYDFLVKSTKDLLKLKPGIRYCVMGPGTFAYIKQQKKLDKERFLGLGVAICKAITTDHVMWFSTAKDADNFAKKVESEISRGHFTFEELIQVLSGTLVPMHQNGKVVLKEGLH